MTRHRNILCYKIFLLTLTALAVLPTMAGATALEARYLFQQGNEAYSRGEYKTAINDYLDITQHYGVSASLLYNLANSYAADGQTGKAVVNDLRALRLDPGNEDIRASLEQVRKDKGLYRQSQPLYERFADLLAPKQWALMAAVTLFLFSLAYVVTFFVDNTPGMVGRGVMFCCLGVLIVSVPAAVFQYRSWNDAVVIAADARLLISPFASAGSSGTIREGRLVRPVKSYGNFFLVADKNGRSGWLNKAALELISGKPSPAPHLHAVAPAHIEGL